VNLLNLKIKIMPSRKLKIIIKLLFLLKIMKIILTAKQVL